MGQGKIEDQPGELIEESLILTRALRLTQPLLVRCRGKTGSNGNTNSTKQCYLLSLNSVTIATVYLNSVKANYGFGRKDWSPSADEWLRHLRPDNHETKDRHRTLRAMSPWVAPLSLHKDYATSLP